MVAAGECDAFNVGMNSGAAAGQTVMYPHVHLIPRRVGDCGLHTVALRSTHCGEDLGAGGDERDQYRRDGLG